MGLGTPEVSAAASVAVQWCSLLWASGLRIMQVDVCAQVLVGLLLLCILVERYVLCFALRCALLAAGCWLQAAGCRLQLADG